MLGLRIGGRLHIYPFTWGYPRSQKWNTWQLFDFPSWINNKTYNLNLHVFLKEQPLRQADFLGEALRWVHFLRFRNCTEFDWYQNWANLRDIISQFIRYDSKILNVGAGNSPFSEAMYAEGYKYITNIDFSEIVVEDMQLKYKNNAYEPTIKCIKISIQTSSAMSAPWRNSRIRLLTV